MLSFREKCYCFKKRGGGARPSRTYLRKLNEYIVLAGVKMKDLWLDEKARV